LTCLLGLQACAVGYC